MPRPPRITIPGLPHHVTHRGNNFEAIFHINEDRLTYLNMLKWFTQKHSVAVLGYCLMTNHVHLILTPDDQDSLASVIHGTHKTYAQYANKRFGRIGHLWQERHFSCAMDEPHCVAALRYVEQNPVRAGLARLPWQYPWSSAKPHVDGTDQEGLLDLEWWGKNFSPTEWKGFLEALEDDKLIAEIRSGTMSGRPAGSEDFLKNLEQVLGVDLRAKTRGRPSTKQK
jgi:putative transposase